jgi:phosphopantetheine adenylyltransferase
MRMDSERDMLNLSKRMTVCESVLEQLDSVEVVRCRDYVVLMVDGQPRKLSVAAASQLAWDLCSKLGRMRESEAA